MDSRDYVCAFTINSAAALPADFPPLPDGLNFRSGLFLPQADLDWLGRRPYPARVVLLTSDALHIIPHPESREPRLSLFLYDVYDLECGRILLNGWIGLRASQAQALLRYNRRSAETVEKFLKVLKALWLPAHPEFAPAREESPRHSAFGPPWKEKLLRAWETEAMEGERPLLWFFQPSEKRVWRCVFKYESWSAGDLAVVSPRRVLWITERRGRVYEPFGTVSFSAPLDALVRVACVQAGRSWSLHFHFSSAYTWQIPLNTGQERNAQAFAAAAAGMLEQRRSAHSQEVRLPCRAEGLP